MTIEVEGVRGCSTVYSALSLSSISKSNALTDCGRPLTRSYTLCLVLIAYSFEQAALVRLTMKMPVTDTFAMYLLAIVFCLFIIVSIRGKGLLTLCYLLFLLLYNRCRDGFSLYRLSKVAKWRSTIVFQEP